MNGHRKIPLLVLFPSFETGSLGGVQASGREAWSGIHRGFGGRAESFSYNDDDAKLLSLARAAGQRVSAQSILVWHIDLLKLAPFIENSDAPITVFLHGIEAWRRQDAFTRLLMKRITRFLTNSGHTWRRFLDVHPEYAGAPHRTVPLGLGEPASNFDGLPDAPPAALMIGRLCKSEDYKGHREVIQAWPRVVTRLPGAQLWIAGEGDLRADLEELAARLGVAEHVTFHGRVTEQCKHELLARCRALLLPSRGEGFGLVYLEAMRIGRPCLVSTIDAGREVVNPPEAGLAADPADPSDLADAICRLLKDGEEWRRWSEQARNRYNSCYTARQFHENLVDALR
jgi:phosphatidylinositol alpha-1,6-mannosyltransferase